MAFGSQMHHSVRTETAKGGRNCLTVADISLQEAIERIGFDRGQRGQCARIGELVDIEDFIALIQHQMPHDGRSDKPGAAGHEYTHVFHYPLAFVRQIGPGSRPVDEICLSSLSLGCVLSLSDKIALSASTGHSILSAGSFHNRPLS